MTAGEVYLVGVLEGCYKIGRSGDSEKRLLSYSPKLPVTLTIHHRVTTDNAVWLESVLHTAFSHRRSIGEWFRLTEEDVGMIRGLIAVKRSDGIPAPLAELVDRHVSGGKSHFEVVHNAIQSIPADGVREEANKPPVQTKPTRRSDGRMRSTRQRVRPSDVIPSEPTPLLGVIEDSVLQECPPGTSVDFSWLSDETHYVVTLYRQLSHDPVTYHAGCMLFCRDYGPLEHGGMVTMEVAGVRGRDGYAIMQARLDQYGFWYLDPLCNPEAMPSIPLGKTPGQGYDAYSLVKYGVVEMYYGQPWLHGKK